MSKIESAEVYSMFETIRSDVEELKEKQPESIEINAVNELADTMRTVINEARKPMTVEKRFTIGFASSRVFIFSIAVTIMLIAACVKICSQRNMTQEYRDNDLKYRYVKMHGEITPGGINDLEEVFRHKRDDVKNIRVQVEHYEKLVREQAEKLEQVRLNDAHAKQLQQEAERIKDSK